MLRLLFATALAIAAHCWPAAAAAQDDCTNGYYRTKSPDCIGTVLSQLRQVASTIKGEPSTIIGFLAEVMRSSPESKQRILADTPVTISPFVLLALHRAGLLNDARLYAEKHRLSILQQELNTQPATTLAAIKPLSLPGDNDLLIGAYMASGDRAYVQRILANFSGADDSIASDAMRVGFLMSKFGATLTPQGRANTVAPALCAKYKCKEDTAKVLRVMTLATGFWALQALGQKDEGIQKTFASFFERDPRLKKLLMAEQVVFGNYLTALVVVTSLKPEPSQPESEGYKALSKSATAYETFVPARDITLNVEGAAKTGKPAN